MVDRNSCSVTLNILSVSQPTESLIFSNDFCHSFGAIDQRVDEPQQPIEPTQPIDIGEGALPIGQGAGIDGGAGLQEPANGDMQEGF